MKDALEGLGLAAVIGMAILVGFTVGVRSDPICGGSTVIEKGDREGAG